MKSLVPGKAVSFLRGNGIAATLIMTLLVGVISMIFALHINNTTAQQCYSDLTSSTAEARVKLENNFRSDRVTLRMLSKVIGEKESLSSMEVGNYLTIYDVNSLISGVGILTSDNSVIRLRGQDGDASGIMEFRTEADLGEHISGLQPSLENPGSMVLRSFMPIRRDGKTVGLLFAEMSPSNIARAWSPEIYGGEVSFCIVDRSSGDFLVNSWDSSLSTVSDLSSAELAHSIRSGETGFMRMESDSSSGAAYVSYMPMELEKWEILVTVDEGIVFADAKSMHRSLRRFLSAEAILFLMYLTWMLYATRKSINETERQANVDVLTGLQNRNRYEDYCVKLQSRTEALGCIYLDANGLHEINNTRGHLAGDQMLRFIADTLKVAFGEDRVYRIGGDEFVVFQHYRSAQQLEEILRRAQAEIMRNDYHVSAGLCMFEETGSVDGMVKLAEERMYAAKQHYYEERGMKVRNSK